MGFLVIGVGYFIPPFSDIVESMHQYQFLGVVFAWLLIFMLVIGEISPRDSEFHQKDVGAVDMTPWALAKPAGLALILIVFAIYIVFADFSVLENAPAAP